MLSGSHQGEQIIIVLLIFFKTPGKILKKIGQLFSSTFTWCYLHLNILQNEIWELP